MKHLPNVLCALRLMLAPMCAAAVLGDRYSEALLLFLIAGLTDFADGYLARRFNWQSRLGLYIDPLADKALMAFTALALGTAGLAPGWLVALVLTRDAMILGGSILVASRTHIREFPPVWSGKVSTTVQIASLIVFLAVPSGFLPAWLVPVAVVATAIATLVSGAEYMKIGWRMMRT